MQHGAVAGTGYCWPVVGGVPRGVYLAYIPRGVYLPWYLGVLYPPWYLGVLYPPWSSGYTPTMVLRLYTYHGTHLGYPPRYTPGIPT